MQISKTCLWSKSTLQGADFENSEKGAKKGQLLRHQIEIYVPKIDSETLKVKGKETSLPSLNSYLQRKIHIRWRQRTTSPTAAYKLIL